MKLKNVLFVLWFVASVVGTAVWTSAQQPAKTVDLHQLQRVSDTFNPAEGGCPAPFATCIVVTSSEDTNGSLNETCNYSGNGGTIASPCNFRRAIREASLRPTSDRPILIAFNMPTNDPNHNSTLETWTIVVEDELPPLSRENTLDTVGQVVINGNTQPNGRSDAPKVIVDTRGTGDIGSYSLVVESTQNLITNLSWKGGGTLTYLVDADGNYVTNLWVNLTDDGQNIELRDPATDPSDLAGAGGIVVLSNSNVISNTVIAGTKFGRAINIDGDDNTIVNNFIGTRADGTVPAVPAAIQCLRSMTYDPSNWYGGWGMQIGGIGNEVSGNILAGLHSTQTEFETPPMALDISGSNHLVHDNEIGVDSAGSEVGVCGIGALVSGNGSDLLNNTFVDSRKGFEEDESDTTIYLNQSSPQDGSVTVRQNIIKDGPTYALNFTGSTPDSLRLFQPAAITSIEGTAVSGSNGTSSPCPNCTIDFYLDDDDTIEEALEWLGSTTADANGDFSFTLASALPEGFGIRTTSTTVSSGIIGTFGAGTTTQMSPLYTELIVFSAYLPMVQQP